MLLQRKEVVEIDIIGQEIVLRVAETLVGHKQYNEGYTALKLRHRRWNEAETFML